MERIKKEILKEIDRYIETWRYWPGDCYTNRILALTVAKKIVEDKFMDKKD